MDRFEALAYHERRSESLNPDSEFDEAKNTRERFDTLAEAAIALAWRPRPSSDSAREATPVVIGIFEGELPQVSVRISVEFNGPVDEDTPRETVLKKVSLVRAEWIHAPEGVYDEPAPRGASMEEVREKGRVYRTETVRSIELSSPNNAISSAAESELVAVESSISTLRSVIQAGQPYTSAS